MSQRLTNEVAQLRQQMAALRATVDSLTVTVQGLSLRLETEYQRKRGRKPDGEHETAARL